MILHSFVVRAGMSRSWLLPAPTTYTNILDRATQYSPTDQMIRSKSSRKSFKKKPQTKQTRTKKKVKNGNIVPLPSLSTEQQATDSQAVGHSAVLNTRGFLEHPTVRTASRQPKNWNSGLINCSQNVMFVPLLADDNLSPHASKATANIFLPSLEKVSDIAL